MLRYSRVTRVQTPFNFAIKQSYKLKSLNTHFFATWIKSINYCRERDVSEIPSNDSLVPLINEMKRAVNDFNRSDADEFWTRKSSKTVLAVLQCRINGNISYFRGRNDEMSLPAGSTCAEQAAISNALANNFSLKREDFMAIAVVDPSFQINDISPCGVCMEKIKKIQEAKPEFIIIRFLDSAMDVIFEQYPQDYPWSEDDGVSPALHKQWECKMCTGMNYGLLISCDCCGFPKKGLVQSLNKMPIAFRDPVLTKAIVNVIFDKFMKKEFSHKTISRVLSTNYGKGVHDSILSLLGWFAMKQFIVKVPKRQKRKPNKWTANDDKFVNYKETLDKIESNTLYSVLQQMKTDLDVTNASVIENI